MTTIITRLYSDEQTARNASAFLAKNGFVDRDRDVISGGEGGVVALRSAGVPADVAAAYAETLAGGTAVLVVRAGFGRAGKARALVAETETIDAGLPKQDFYVRGGLRPHTGRPVARPEDARILTGSGPGGALISTPTPFSSWLGMTLLSTGPRSSSVMAGNKKITPGSHLTTWTLNTPLMTDNVTPFSSLLGWKTLTKQKERTSLPLTKSRTPFSDLLGMAPLSRPRS